jgi:hypothetical protein
MASSVAQMIKTSQVSITTGGEDDDNFTITTNATIDVPDDTGTTTPTIVLDIPATQTVANHQILVTISVVETIDIVPDIDVFMEASHNGTDWTDHSLSGANTSIELTDSLPVDTVGTYVYSANLYKQTFPYYRIGINSNGYDIDGLGLEADYTSINNYTSPNYRDSFTGKI